MIIKLFPLYPILFSFNLDKPNGYMDSLGRRRGIQVLTPLYYQNKSIIHIYIFALYVVRNTTPRLPSKLPASFLKHVFYMYVYLSGIKEWFREKKRTDSWIFQHEIDWTNIASMVAHTFNSPTEKNSSIFAIFS